MMAAHRPVDPLHVMRMIWPHAVPYDREQEIVHAVRDSAVTFAPAANMVGKDWIAGRIAVGAFLCPQAFLLHPDERPPAGNEVRIITTSVKDDHLRVLWGEIGRAIQDSAEPLEASMGGPLVVNFRDVRKRFNGRDDKISYMRGMVSEKGEGMAGHHAAYTLGIIDEASGVDDLVFLQMRTWARRILVIGNTNPCQNFFRDGCKKGDLLATGDYA